MYTGVLITNKPDLASQIHEVCRLIPVTLTHVVTLEELDQDRYVDVIFWGYDELSFEQFQTIKNVGACIISFIHRSIREKQKLTSPPRTNQQFQPHWYETYPILPRSYADTAEEYRLISDRYAR